MAPRRALGDTSGGRWTVRFVLTAAMVGCSASTPGLGGGVQVGGEGDPEDTCGSPTVDEVAFGLPVLDGQTADGVLALIAGPTVYEPEWFDGRLSTVTVTVSATTSTATVTDYPDATVGGCARRIAFPASISFLSEDGALDESWAVTVHQSAPWDSVDLAGQIRVAERGGSLDWTSLAPDTTQLVVYLRFGADGDVGYAELRPDTEPNEPLRICGWDLRL